MQPIDIIKAGSPILKRPSKVVTNFGSKELYDLIDHLFYNLEYYNGAGIAAPQIGESQRVFVYGFSHNPRYSNVAPIDKTVLINPEISFFSEEQENFYEGCLSLPNIRGLVPRASIIQVKFQDVFGNNIERNVSGFEARIIQHELDHLNGILFPMRITDLSSIMYSEN